MDKILTENIQFLLSKGQKEKLLIKVKKTDLTLSHYIRRLIDSHLKEKKE